jgi:hypothetical protein
LLYHALDNDALDPVFDIDWLLQNKDTTKRKQTADIMKKIETAHSSSVIIDNIKLKDVGQVSDITRSIYEDGAHQAFLGTQVDTLATARFVFSTFFIVVL